MRLGVGLVTCFAVAAAACRPRGALHSAGAPAPAIILYQDGGVIDGRLAFISATPPWQSRYDIGLHSRADASGLRSIVTLHNPTNSPWRAAVVQLAATSVPVALRPAMLGVDNDSDGVLDAEDICSEDDVGPGAAPAEDCPDTAAIFAGSVLAPLLYRVTFVAKNSPVLQQSTQAIVDVATLLQQTPDIQLLEVGAHTVVGERVDIAVQRLWAVLAMLQAHGVAAERLLPLLYAAPVREPIGWVDFRLLQTRRQWRNVERSYDARHELTRRPEAHAPAAMRVTLPNLVDVAPGASREFTLMEVPLEVEVVNWWQPKSTAPPVPALLLRNPNLSTIAAGAAMVRNNRAVLGSATLSALAPNATQVVPFAANVHSDMHATVHTTVQHDEVPLRIVAAHDGILYVERAMRRRTTYRIDDAEQLPNRVLVAHARSQRYFVAEAAPSAVDLGDTLAVPLSTAMRTQTVDERTVFTYEYALDAADIALAPYVANSQLNAETERALRAIGELREQVLLAQQALQSLVTANPQNAVERKALQQTLVAQSQRYFERSAALSAAAHALNIGP